VDAFVNFIGKYLVPPLARLGEEKHMKGIRMGILNNWRKSYVKCRI